MTSGVYLFSLGGSEPFKVGHSSNIQDRLRGLSRYYSIDWQAKIMVLPFDVSLARKTEFAIHQLIPSDRKVLMEYDGGTEFYEGHLIQRVKDLYRTIGKIHGTEPIMMDWQQELQDWECEVDLQNEVHGELAALGLRVRKYRVSMGATQERIASICGVSKRTIERLESGRGATLENAISVLKVLGISWVPTPDELQEIHPKSRVRKRTLLGN